MRSVPGWGVLTSAAAPVLLIGGWTLAAGLRPDRFDSVKDTISDLAAVDAPNRWVMTAALVGVGAAHVGTAIALRPAAPASRWLLATGGVATILVAANPLPADGGPAPEHALAAGVAFVALGAWPAISWRRDRRGGQPGAASQPPTETGPAERDLAEPRAETQTGLAEPDQVEAEPAEPRADHAGPVPFRPAVALAAGGVLLGGLGWFFAELLNGTDRVGLSERVAAGSQALWPLAAVLLSRRPQQRAPERSPSS